MIQHPTSFIWRRWKRSRNWKITLNTHHYCNFLAKNPMSAKRNLKIIWKSLHEYCCIKESQIREYKNPSVTFWKNWFNAVYYSPTRFFIPWTNYHLQVITNRPQDTHSWFDLARKWQGYTRKLYSTNVVYLSTTTFINNLQ